MSKELEITISEDGSMSIEGFGLSPNETVKDLAKDFTDAIGTVSEYSHKHKHSTSGTHKEFE